jgi:transitional endoplasmic reticulum ATPase
MKQLLKDIGGLLELQASIFGMVAAGALCLGWLWALFSAWFQGRPILYSFEAAASPETIFVIGLIALELFAVGWNLLEATLLRRGYLSAFNFVVTPWITLLAALVLAAWWMTGPNPKASFIPLVALLFVSAWVSYEHHYGRLGPKQRARTERGDPGDAGENEPARVYKPQTTFASICGNDAIKQRLKDAAAAITAPRKSGGKPRNGILLHGAPGNGKTVFAEALAGELGLLLVTLTFADVASQWVGEKSSRVRQAFEQAKHAQPCVLFLDEVDSFLEARDGRSDGVKEDRDLTNALLTLMVDIRQQRVILMAATNHMDRLDAAAVREGRFDFKVEITPPDAPARLGLLWKGLKDNLPGRAVDESVVQAVAQRWNGFSVKRILAVTEELPVYLKEKGSKRIEFDDFMGALRQLQGQRGAKPENVKPLSELLLSADTRESLELIAGRMADPEHTERHGGTLPTGVLFSGPPGTGKTATAKALAADLGWGFLPATGAELARDPAKLQTLYTKAQDLRPAIIFIDEADELLRSREFSPSTDATNKLLTLMDGVGDRVRDVVWVAATNHPEGVDAALLRGGRFTEKVRFELPDAAILASFVQDWLGKRKVQLAAELSVKKVAALLGEQSIADAEAILQAALNRAVARRTTPVVVTGADVGQALRTVAA